MVTEYRFQAQVKIVRPPRELAGLKPGWTGYLRTLFGGLMLTARYFFRPKVTMQYPEEKRQFPETYRGFPRLIFNTGAQMENCVACKLCERVCPPRAISIVIGEHDQPAERERRPARFVIDYGRCIVCGYCAEACPCDAIGMSKEYEHAAYARQDLLKDKERLLVPKDRLRVNP